MFYSILYLQFTITRSADYSEHPNRRTEATEGMTFIPALN